MKRFILLLVTLFAMTNVMAQLQPDMPIPADKGCASDDSKTA